MRRLFLLTLLIGTFLFPGLSAHASEEPITRAEALKALLLSKERYRREVLWFREHLPRTSLFTDTDQAAWYAPYLEVGFLEGIIRGYHDGTFRPGAPLTHADAQTLLLRVYGEGVALEPPAEPHAFLSRSAFFRLLSSAIQPSSPPPSLSPSVPALPSLSLDAPPESRSREEVSSLPREEPAKPLTVHPIPTPLPTGKSDIPLPERSDALQYSSSKPFAITIPKLQIFDMTVTHPIPPYRQEDILAPLTQGVGHLFGYPGTSGKIMIYGHSSNWPWIVSEYSRIFRRINQLEPGDRVYVTYAGKLHVYEVTHQESRPTSDVSAFNDNGREELILYTCWPPDSIRERLHVFTRPVQTLALQ
jgi:LPXTG-site transpeptidase (sortase) family protein